MENTGPGVRLKAPGETSVPGCWEWLVLITGAVAGHDRVGNAGNGPLPPSPGGHGLIQPCTAKPSARSRALIAGRGGEVPAVPEPLQKTMCPL